MVRQPLSLCSRQQKKRLTGVEPAYLAWEASVLPMYYNRITCIFYGECKDFSITNCIRRGFYLQKSYIIMPTKCRSERGSMSKITFQKPGNFIYPVPAVMVSLRDASGKSNIITIAWTGTICSDPPMAYISVRKNRASYPMLKESGEFVINLPSEGLVRALDYCGVRSLDQVDKWADMKLHEGKASVVSAPTIEEAPVSIECRVTQVLPLGSHDMFLAEVVAVDVDERYIDERGAFHMDEVGLVAYSHGDYMSLGKKLGSFGYSVRKKPGKASIGQTKAAKTTAGRKSMPSSAHPASIKKKMATEASERAVPLSAEALRKKKPKSSTKRLSKHS